MEHISRAGRRTPQYILRHQRGACYGRAVLALTAAGDRTHFNDFYRTPDMEALAERGVRFTEAYAATVCSPTRTSIMTGQNPARHRVTNWTLRADRDTSGETTRLRAPAQWERKGLQPSETTLPALLSDAGYTTIHVGKAHWGADAG